MRERIMHHLEIHQEYLDAIISGEKTWEMRERRNRDFQVGDLLALRMNKLPYLGTIVEITYIMENRFGLKDGWVIMSIKPVEENE